MKIAIFAFLMVIVLMLVESGGWGRRRRGGGGVFGGRRGGGGGFGGGVAGSIGGKGTSDRVRPRIDTGMRLKRDLNNKLVQRDLGNGQNRYIRDVNKKHHVHMSYERIPDRTIIMINQKTALSLCSINL